MSPSDTVVHYIFQITGYVVSQTEKTHSLIGNILRGEDLPVGPVSVIDLEPVRVLTTQLRSPLLAPALGVKNLSISIKIGLIFLGTFVLIL